MKILKQKKINNDKELLLYGGSFSRNNILVIGVVHGDEPQGFEIISKYIKEKPDSNLLFIPCLNPTGMEKGTRVNYNGVDINRNFPTKNWEYSEKDNYFGGEKPASEDETKFVMEVIDEYFPKCILTLHTPYKIVNYDGPARNIAEEISKIINYPVEESIGYPTPGSFGTYVGIEKNIPVITLEMDEEEKTEILYLSLEKIFGYLESL